MNYKILRDKNQLICYHGKISNVIKVVFFLKKSQRELVITGLNFIMYSMINRLRNSTSFVCMKRNEYHINLS